MRILSPLPVLAVLVMCPVACSGGEGGLTDDQLEYGTRSKDRRFLQQAETTVANDFDAPFDLLAREQEAIRKQTGVTLYFDYYGNFLGNPSGGLSSSSAYAHEIVAGGHFDLEKICGWRGATLTASFGEGAGRNLSEDIGNYFGVSEAYVGDYGALFDLYLTQKLFDDRLTLRVGRMSAGQMFASLPAFGLQVSGGIDGNPNSLFSNAPFHSGITATNAGMAKYDLTKTSYVSAGVFQATPRLGLATYHGTDFSIRSGDGILAMYEAGWKPTFDAGGPGRTTDRAGGENPGLPGIYKAGGYYSNYTFDRFSGGEIANACGFYTLGQQMLWRSEDNPNDNFSVWGGAVYSPQTEIALVPLMGMAGTIWQGLIPGRGQDQWLTCFLIGNFSDAYANTLLDQDGSTPTTETVLETSYVIQLNKHLSVQPDLQYVIRPNGEGDIQNALVIGLQVVLSF